MKSTQSNPNVHGIVLAILAANFFSSKVLLVKLAYAEGASPMLVLGLRMATALPFFAGILLWVLAKRAGPRPKGGDYFGMTLLGLVGYYLASVLDFHGITYLTSSMERLLLYLYPSFLVLIRSSLERSLPSRREVMALLLAYTGLGLVYYDEQQFTSSNVLLGSALVLGSSLCYAGYLYFSGRYVEKFGSRLFASYSTTVSCLAIMLHSLLVQGEGGSDLSLRLLVICLVIGIFCTVVPTMVLHHAVSLIGSAKVGILGTTGIFAPFILGILLFGEPLTATRVAGTSLILASVIWLSRK